MTDPLPEIPNEWFGGEAPPLVLDLGCHRGQFLVSLAQEHPEWNVLGVERLSERVERTRCKIQRLGLENAAVVCAEVGQFIVQLPPASISHAHILFPDPWPKRRHASRRLLQKNFLETLSRALQPGATLRILTDHQEYAQQAIRLLNESGNYLEGQEPHFPLTAFEEKFLRRGQVVHRIYRTKALAAS